MKLTALSLVVLSSLSTAFAAEKLSPEEKIQLPLIKCVDKLAKKDKLDEARHVLTLAFDGQDQLSTDKAILDQARELCRDYRSGRILDATTELKNAISSGECKELSLNKSTQISRLLDNLASPRITRCSERHYDVSAGFLLNIKTGINNLKCERSDGSIVKYIGPKIAFGLGAGASITTRRLDNYEISYNTGKVGATSTMDHHDDMVEISAILGGGKVMHGTQTDDRGFGIGLQGYIHYESYSAQLRSFNGKRNWKEVFRNL